MSESPLQPIPKLLKMWKAINNACLVLLIFPLLMLVFGAPWELCLLIIVALAIVWGSIQIYIPAFYRSLEYSIDTDAVRLQKGVFWKRRTTVPYAKITNIDITQGPVERHFGLSKLHIQTAGSSAANNNTAELLMLGIAEPEALKDEIIGRIHLPAGIEPSPPPPTAPNPASPDILKAILDEVSAIRHTLQKS